MKPPVCVFFGSDAICLPILEALISSSDRLELRAVVSQPDRRQGRGKSMKSNPVAAWAKKNEITLLQPEKPSIAEWMRSSTAIALVMVWTFLNGHCAGANSGGGTTSCFYYQISGAAPFEWAIANGDRRRVFMQVGKQWMLGMCCSGDSRNRAQIFCTGA